MTALVLMACLCAAQWQHPAGMITNATLDEMRSKVASQPWAATLFEQRRATLNAWLDTPLETIREVFPKKRGNVYHNFSCPDDRTRLVYEDFNPYTFKCASCGKTYAPDTDPGIYKPDDRYHGTMYDGWVCFFYQRTGAVAVDLAVLGHLTGDERYFQRSIDLLVIFADVIKTLEKDGEGQFGRILTYHREGDNKILDDLALAYELVRDRMSMPARSHVERDALERMLNDMMLEPYYPYDHNNVYQWHRTILQTALALEREDLINWCFGYGEASPERLPEHRSLRRIVATHFKPDGAFWELCSGYHLYPMYAFCEIAILSHNLVQMDPERFPRDLYDYSTRDTPGGRAIEAALQWFMSMAMPDRTVTVIGDSTKARAGMNDYDMTAEVGYRYFNMRSVGDYPELRAGRRSWPAFLYGAPEIVEGYTPFTSSFLSSGWVSLRNEWRGNQTWVGLNALIPGGGHQHADRLTFTYYSHGKLLALEKATPYNEEKVRILGTLTPAHNTVTVDKVSQKQGESLAGDEIPQVYVFFEGPWAKVAEVRADKLYGQTTAYRRTVILVEDVAVDVFRVRGGETHDWIVNHAGSRPHLVGEDMTTSLSGETVAFEPEDWVLHGSPEAFLARPEGAWSALWDVEGVTSRLTMVNGAGAKVYALETYPIENAIVTKEHPPCATLCVRRADQEPFVAVWDSWTTSPSVREVKGADGPGFVLGTTEHRYLVATGPGSVTDEGGISLSGDAAWCIVRDRDAITWVDGTWVELGAAEGGVRLSTDRPVTLSAEFRDGALILELSENVQYETVAGRDVYRDRPKVRVAVRGNLWHVRETWQRYAGHASLIRN